MLDATVWVVVSCLERCFEVLGAPHVLKFDSGLRVDLPGNAEALLRRGLKHALSPPPLGQYNGSVDASIRWLNVRTEREARNAGRPGAWRREDMKQARQEANSAVRRRVGVAEECWFARQPIGGDVRRAFVATVARKGSAYAQQG